MCNKKSNINLLLSVIYKELIDSFLKNSSYFYDFIETEDEIYSTVLITDYTHLNEGLEHKFCNLEKIICLIPNRYSTLVSDRFKISKIVFLELPITADKIFDELKVINI